MINLKVVLPSRSRGRGRKEADEEGKTLENVALETPSRVTDVLLRSDDIRMADMDISEDGET